LNPAFAAQFSPNVAETRIPIEVLPDYEEELNNLTFLTDCHYKFFQITTDGLVERKKFVAGNNRDYLLTTKQ
jgi:hypothetical protein